MFLHGMGLILLGLIGPGQHLKPLSASTIFQRESRYIATIRTYDDLGRPISQGSGVIILILAEPPASVIATNLHVLRGACNVYIEIPTEEGPKPIWGVIGLDSDNDVVLIAVGDGKLPFDRTETGSMNLKPGDPVYAIGNPMGFELTITEGIVSGIRKTLQGRRIQVTTPISHGSSGGGLYDRFGRLVGITSYSVEGAQNLNFAIPIEVVDQQVELTGKEWYEAREFFCKPDSHVPTLDELRAVLGMHVADSNVRAFFAKLGGGDVPQPIRTDIPGFFGDITGYSFYSSLGLVYAAEDGLIYRLLLYGPGFIEGRDAYYRGDLPFGLQWGMSGDEVRYRFAWDKSTDREYGEDQQNFDLVEGKRGSYLYGLTIKNGRLTFVDIELPRRAR